MGTIIHLNPQQKTAAPPAAGQTPRCEIVIFPGVRIERDAPPLAAETGGRQTDGDVAHRRRPRKSS